MSFSVFEITRDWAATSGLEVQAPESAPSTNDLAKEHAFDETEALSIYLTDEQTKGRGRGTNTWTARTHGAHLLSTWSFQLREAPQPVMAPAIGLALYKAAQSTWMGFEWSLKAPNDLYLKNRKVAGLLLENVQQGPRHRLLIGLGVNVHAHPGVDRSGAMADMIPPKELSIEIWRQFLDRLLLEITAALLTTHQELHAGQCRALLTALNQFPDTTNAFKSVRPDGGLEPHKGPVIDWHSL